jgi:pimeloyl-ACP methyl ester carboxylesterase
LRPSAPIEPDTLEGLAQRPLDLIEALCCDSVMLVRHSLGGMVAQALPARRPERVNRRVLCGTLAAFARRSDGTRADGWAQRFIARRCSILAWTWRHSRSG